MENHRGRRKRLARRAARRFGGPVHWFHGVLYQGPASAGQDKPVTGMVVAFLPKPGSIHTRQ